MTTDEVRSLHRSRARSWGRFANRYGGFVAIALALSLIIWIAPTTSGGSGPGLGNFSPSATGVPAGPQDCARQASFGQILGCKPIWNGGSNGGATSKGVTGNSITIVAYGSADASLIANLLGGPGKLVGTPQQELHTLNVYEKFFNKYFQTYGRHIHLIPYTSTGSSANISAISRSDAVAIDQSNNAFMTISGIDENFFDELAQRHVVNIAGAQLPQSFYAQHSPYVFGMLPTTDTMNSFIAAFVGKQLGPGSKAQYGGDNSDPPVNGQTRKYGIVYPTTNPDGTPSIYADTAKDLAGKLATYGIQVSPGDEVGYALDPNSAITQVQADGSRLRDDGITTIICLCDPISPIFSMTAAAKQGYFPENIETGYLLQDYYQLGRLYDPTEMSHTFGVSELPQSAAPQQSLYYQAYQSIDPTTQPTPDAALMFYELLMAFAGIERAGPDLTPTTFANGMFSISITSNSPGMPTFHFSRSDYGGIKDAQIVWWSNTAKGPDGQPGNFEAVDGGYRYLAADWPSGDPHVFDPACLPMGSCGAPSYPAPGTQPTDSHVPAPGASGPPPPPISSSSSTSTP